ncbi:beta-mannosidase [Paenibacillus sp. oral taxon 786]|uniref:beta-mannosidase n=1 Tax=Paenibacillus sp. oral taxon 786 TaxID=652715 RepID=UPI0002EBF310|nr:glycoside hydrolase family 2 protein [Paenibacillus sp. oral taxon 786]
MKTLDLGGSWRMRRLDEAEWIPSVVPGSVYNDLLNAGKMEDPFYRENDRKALLLSQYDYEYEKRFCIDEDFLNEDRILLRCEGLDTLAEIRINGHEIARTDNMHRTYEFDLKHLLSEGDNVLVIIFRSPLKYIQEKHDDNPLWSVNGSLGFAYLRKAHYMFGWDWGPVLPDAGIWRPIQLIALSHPRIDEVYVVQDHLEEDRVNLNIRVGLERKPDRPITAVLELFYPNGGILSAHQFQLVEASGNIHITINEPQLWWPNGYGDQPLYQLEVRIAEDSLSIDKKSLRIGLRTITVNQQEDPWGRSFAFCVNGLEIFAMGGNYVPEDNLISRGSREKTERIIRDCVRANYNSIRVWGGGYYPEDYFYDLCDEYGLLVWQDHLFACAVYDFTEDFRVNVIEEVTQNMKRIRHHASLGLWCGNNEIEWAWVDWDIGQSPKLKSDYIKQFEYVLPEIAKKVDPQTFYWLASPSSFGGFDQPNSQDYGDMHDWSIWHGRKPFTDFRSRFPRFMSEFGLQAFPSYKTVKTFTLPEDRNVFSAVMENHQKHEDGLSPMLHYLAQYFKMPKDFQSFLYVSQLMQAEGVRYGVEHWRRNRGRCMGAIYWQLNDAWPVASWSSLDYFGRWKALHYAAKRFYAPLLISAHEDGNKVSLHITNEMRKDVAGTITWRLCDLTSAVVCSGETEVIVTSLSTALCENIDLSPWLDNEDEVRSHYLEYSLTVDGESAGCGITVFAPPKHVQLDPAQLSVSITEHEQFFEFQISSSTFAMFVELDLEIDDVVFSDNYFHLAANQPKKITVSKEGMLRSLTIQEMKEQLVLRSLSDSYI